MKSSQKSIAVWIFILFNIVVSGTGAALSLKAAVGVGAWDALSSSIAELSSLKVGTVSMFLNIACVAIQWLYQRKKFSWVSLVQIPMAIILGYVVNLVLYDLLGSVHLTSYPMMFAMFATGIALLVVGVGNIMSTKVVSFPLEAACLVTSEHHGLKFGQIRQAVDVVSIILSLALSLMFSLGISVREGTVIGMLIFGPGLEIWIRFMQPKLIKAGIISE